MGGKSMRKPEKQKKQRERIYAALLGICMMLSLVSVPVLAAEMRKGAGSHEHTRSVIRGRKHVSMSMRRNVTRRRIQRNKWSPHLMRWSPPSAAMYAVRKAAASQKN